VYIRGEAPDDERPADSLRTVQGQRQAGAKTDREWTVSIALRRRAIWTRLVVTDDRRLPCEHAHVPDLLGSVLAARIASDRVVSFVAKRAAGGVLAEDGEGSSVLL
jgi:hypothetical protein